MSDSADIEMPKYQSVNKKYTKVWAFKIKEIVNLDNKSQFFDRFQITPEEPNYAPIIVDGEFISRCQPKVGGYYAVYPDGYKMYLTSEFFTAIYQRI